MGRHARLATDRRRFVSDRATAALCRFMVGPAAGAKRLADAQLVVQFGSSLTGKRLLQWQEQCQPQEYWLIDDLPGRLDPAHHRGGAFVPAWRSGLSCTRPSLAPLGQMN